MGAVRKLRVPPPPRPKSMRRLVLLAIAVAAAWYFGRRLATSKTVKQADVTLFPVGVSGAR